jgi:hypothetical protein
MATSQALKALALTAQQQQAQAILPTFPKLSEFAPKLAKIDQQGVAKYEQAIALWLKNATFIVQGGAN